MRRKCRSRGAAVMLRRPVVAVVEEYTYVTPYTIEEAVAERAYDIDESQG